MRKEEVIDLHYGFFKDFGFEFHPQNFLFEKSFPQGNQVIFVHYTEYPDATYLEYKLGVRIHAVESIIHKFLPTLSDFDLQMVQIIQKLKKRSNSKRSHFFSLDLLEIELSQI